MDGERHHETMPTLQAVPQTAAQRAWAGSLAWSHAMDAVFDVMTDGALIFNDTGQVLRMNAAARTLLGLDDYTDDTFARLAPAERAAQIALRDERGRPVPRDQGALRRLLNGETLTGSNAVDVIIHTLDGREVQHTVTGAPVRDEAGQIVGAVLVFRDVTERRLLLLAQEEDRRRVAYEVHDGLAQVAASAHQHLQAFARRYRPRSAQARQEFDRVLDLVRQTVTEARRVVADLRPSLLDDAGLAAAIGLQVEELRSVGWQVTYHETLGPVRLPAAVETALFRVAQEALTNVRKHAHTTQVQITLEYAGSLVRLVVKDEGRGFVPHDVPRAAGAGERLGLAGMRKRVALLSGSLAVQSHPGAGTRITAEVPLLAVPQEGAAHGR